MAEYFPIFIQSKGKKVVIIGGGVIGTRRAITLTNFDWDIHIIAPDISKELERLEREQKIHVRKGCYEKEDLEGAYLVIAASNIRTVNRQVGLDAASAGILVSVADAKEECTFFFPGIAQEGALVAGVTSGGEDHKRTRKVTGRIRNILKEEGAE